MKKIFLIFVFISFSFFPLFCDDVDLPVGEDSSVVEVADSADVVDVTEDVEGADIADDTEVADVVEATATVTEDVTELAEDTEVTDLPEESESVEAAVGGIAEVPPAKRPRPVDPEKAAAAAEKDESEEDVEKFRKTIMYGIPSEISELMDDLIKNEDPRFTDAIYDVFQVTKNSQIKEKIIKYFTKLEDPCLEDFAVNLLNDPYDETKDVVKATFQYVSTVKTKAAAPAVITLIESENEQYFNDAISALGDIGGAKEAVFLVEYLDREDLSDAQRQSLMRTCGKMHAVQTWDRLVEILENDDENAFVRMYAAEAIGLMKVDKSVPVLLNHFGSSDPNLRQYVIKGLLNFPENKEAQDAIIQGIRDEHWKVRQECIKAAKEMDMKDATPYLIYRAKNDSEKLIKDESITTLAKLNTEEGNTFLIEQVTGKKVGDATKKKVIEVLLKEGTVGEPEILELAQSCVKDDKRKDLRYAIGKELAKHAKPEYADICLLYLQSKDTTTQSIGVDIYKNCKFASVEPRLREIYDDKKTNANLKKRIEKMLKIDEEKEAEEKEAEAKKSEEQLEVKE